MQIDSEPRQNSEQKLEGFDSSQLIKWILGIFIVAVIAFIVVLGMYWLLFDGEISKDHQVWGTFGDYVGGVLNPFFSFLALLALLLTINIQNLQLERSKDESKKQAEHLEREFKRIDYHRLIEKLAERINQNYKEKYIFLTVDSQTYQISIFQAIHKGTLPRQNIDLERIRIDYENKSPSTFNTIWMIEDDLQRLYIYIKKYELLSQYSGSPIQHFYKREFKDLITALIQNEWISNSENIALFYEFIYTN
jgi:hypothetical protein